MALDWVPVGLWSKKHLYVFTHGCFFELLGCLGAVVLYKIVDDSLLEPKLDGNVLAKDDLTFKNVLVGEDQLNA